MSIKLKRVSRSPVAQAWNDLPSPSPEPEPTSLPSPPISWLSARDMKMFGAQPLSSTTQIGVAKCRDCDKPVLRSYMAEHAATCVNLRAGGKKVKGIVEVDDPKKGKKRKASAEPDEAAPPANKKTKPAPKVTKRTKGPVDYDRQCGVINDKGLPCSRSLTCKSHSMGAKRAVEGRSRKYDDLLLDWQRANNPNFVEPVKRETKAERKEKKEKEKLEKKRLAEEAAAALGLDPTKKNILPGLSKKASKKAAASAIRLADAMAEEQDENLDGLDSEGELDGLLQSVQVARAKKLVMQPLAIPRDAGSWFVQRRERARVCRDLLFGALSTANTGVTAGVVLPPRTTPISPISGRMN